MCSFLCDYYINPLSCAIEHKPFICFIHSFNQVSKHRSVWHKGKWIDLRKKTPASMKVLLTICGNVFSKHVHFLCIYGKYFLNAYVLLVVKNWNLCFKRTGAKSTGAKESFLEWHWKWWIPLTAWLKKHTLNMFLNY